jgi:hypothetical protein
MGSLSRSGRGGTGRRSSAACVWLAGVIATAAGLLAPPPLFAQGTSGPIVSDSKVGYIDAAIPGDVFRLRYDTTYNNRRPSRAEFFYAQTAPAGPGLPFPEPGVDYQDFSAYAELTLLPRLSTFVEVPTRILNPDVNANTAGLGDLNAGFKVAFVQADTGVLTFQLRTYVPTGDADRGLGTNHVSLEPGLLFYEGLGCRAGLEGELRYTVPVGGTDFAGDVIRYGLGVHYDVFRGCEVRVAPVAEFVGWTVLGGKESVVFPTGLSDVRGAAGDTIVNAKVGVRLGLADRADVYAGYGRPLTGERWYESTFRFELRLLY